MASPAITQLVEEPQRPITFEEYRALPEDGPRVELINGELFEIAPPNLRHQFASGELFVAIDDYAMRNESGLVLFGPYSPGTRRCSRICSTSPRRIGA